ncbi:MAG: hypothetical protein M3Z75_08180 [Actinomycetota bacterium]|nr:hypothetical protein [Actinomycetota bacterium]
MCIYSPGKLVAGGLTVPNHVRAVEVSGERTPPSFGPMGGAGLSRAASSGTAYRLGGEVAARLVTGQ